MSNEEEEEVDGNKDDLFPSLLSFLQLTSQTQSLMETSDSQANHAVLLEEIQVDQVVKLCEIWLFFRGSELVCKKWLGVWKVVIN